MDQSRRGATQVVEAQHPLVVAIPRFIQLRMPLSLLKLMGRSRRFKGSKGKLIWINLGIATTRGCCASIMWDTPRRDWSIGFKGGKGTLSWINLALPLLPLKPMGQSRRGVTDFMEARTFLGYFVWKITILHQKIIFFPIAERGAKIFAATLYQGNHGINHKLWNIRSTERYIRHMKVLLEWCYI
jgi:hypothetical protein